ncbi:hypothetical protein OCU04_010060 [Sclerotinia nivalis]|uniref:Lccl domain-containing protein n=1 Tax=Sclerotinia nivalis TaxID=352851 RepID=A0A9X0ADS8_9HELO|nr:hypothetical protein OCU04_010060 [Sclerotinia nivalis]
MAAPPEKHIHDINGSWLLNKRLSDPIEHILRLQNVNWFIRRGISFAEVTLHTTQTQDENGLATLTMERVASMGLAGTTEIRQLNWDTKEHKDHVWGNTRIRSRYIPTADVEEGEEFLTLGWLEETALGDCIQDKTESAAGSWSSVAVWGFELIKEERRLARHILVRKGYEIAMAKLVYDYIGPVQNQVRYFRY